MGFQGEITNHQTNEYKFESSGTNYKTIEITQINLFTNPSPNSIQNDFHNHYDEGFTFWPFVHFIRDEYKWLSAERYETQTLIDKSGFNGLFYEFGLLEFCIYSLLFIGLLLSNYLPNKEKYFKVEKTLKIKEGFSLRLIDNLKSNKYISNGITIPCLVGVAVVLTPY